jgi:hypothetical protein
MAAKPLHPTTSASVANLLCCFAANQCTKLLCLCYICCICVAGFGFPCVAATVFFPLHIGAALANLLFPVFILVACASDPLAAQSESQ